MEFAPQLFNTSIANPINQKDAYISRELLGIGRVNADTALQRLASRLDGLTQAEAHSRLRQYGLNVIAREKLPEKSGCLPSSAC